MFQLKHQHEFFGSHLWGGPHQNPSPIVLPAHGKQHTAALQAAMLMKVCEEYPINDCPEV